jgi:hypothetical protein
MFPYTIDCDVYCIDGGKRAKGRDGEVFVFKLNTTLNLPLTFQELKTEIKSACTSALTYDMHMKGVGVEELYELAMEGLMGEKIKSNIIEKNPFKHLYNANNDLFIHIRLTDVAHYNPGIDYYLNTIKTIQFNNLYISTDDPSHHIVQTIIAKYSKANIIYYDEITAFQFGSTCKYIILSHGTFSAVIGYLSFFSNVYYPEYELGKIWYGDAFSINGWVKMSVC